MTEKEKMYEQLYKIYISCDNDISKINEELDEIGRQSRSIVIKTINGNRYYYEQWRDGDSTKSRNLGRVEPGVISELESRAERRKELLLKYADALYLRNRIKNECDILKKELAEVEPDEYSFEVYYKNDISARVSVRKSKVHVSRYIIHPINQLFCSDTITRNQLNEIFKLRCFDENRYDAADKLRAMGLSEYNPQKIVRITHGVSYNDYLWFRFPGEKLRAEDVLVRDEYVKDRIR